MSATQAFYDAMHGPRVTINVGIEGGRGGQQTFSIPKPLLCEYEWFAKALEPDRSRKSETNTITLADDPPHAFNAFHYYIYHKDITYSDPPVLHSPDRAHYAQQLCETWVFGDKYGIPGLQNCAMYRLCLTLSEECDRSTDSDMPLETMTYCIEHTVPAAKLRNLVVDSVMHSVKGNLDHKMDTFPLDNFSRLFTCEDFVRDLFGAYALSRAGKGKPYRLDLKIGDLRLNQEVHHLIYWANWPRYKKPFLNAERYEVPMTAAAAGKVPVESHAMWFRAHTHTRCELCGNDEGELCCRRCLKGETDAPDLTCECGRGDVIRVCSDCQSSDLSLY